MSNENDGKRFRPKLCLEFTKSPTGFWTCKTFNPFVIRRKKQKEKEANDETTDAVTTDNSAIDIVPRSGGLNFPVVKEEVKEEKKFSVKWIEEEDEIDHYDYSDESYDIL